MAASLGVSQFEREFRVVEYQPAGKEVSAEAEEFLLLEVVTRKRLVETVTGWEY
jgi:hypothetical protein